jgi:hypothetical protein
MERVFRTQELASPHRGAIAGHDLVLGSTAREARTDFGALYSHSVDGEIALSWVTLVVAALGAAATTAAAWVAVRVAGRDARDRRRHQAEIINSTATP